MGDTNKLILLLHLAVYKLLKAAEELIYGRIKSHNENALYSSRSCRNLLRFWRKKIKF